MAKRKKPKGRNISDKTDNRGMNRANVKRAEKIIIELLKKRKASLTKRRIFRALLTTENILTWTRINLTLRELRKKKKVGMYKKRYWGLRSPIIIPRKTKALPK